MARLISVKAAQKDIYHFGREVEYVSKKGKREGETLSKIDKTLPALDNPNESIHINKGEPYYHWEFKNGPKQYSKTPPKPSQLINSPFLRQVQEIQERVGEFECTNEDDFNTFRDELVDEIEQMRDECQEKLDGMPESLQSAPSGEMLQGRVDSLEEWSSEISNVSMDIDEDEDEDAQLESIDNALSELQDASYGGE